MDQALLSQHIAQYVVFLKRESGTHAKEAKDRKERKAYYAAWTSERLSKMTVEEFQEFLSKLWAMLIWGNKKYVADKIIQDNGIGQIRDALTRLLWGSGSVDKRWDWFRSNVKGMGPAMISELLCYTHPQECMLWNRRAYVAFQYLGVESLPRYDYQLTGQRYLTLSAKAEEIAVALRDAGFKETDLLAVDYFMWREMQRTENLSQLHKNTSSVPSQSTLEKVDSKTSTFIHNDVRDKLTEIGEWLGFKSNIEVKIAPGSKVDAVWEATIGNMGRVIYVFEVQTKGSIDSLIINLLKSLKNPAVQGLVAVTDKQQIKKIKAHAADVAGLHGKLKYWDYEEVLVVYESLARAYESINTLELVPEGF